MPLKTRLISWTAQLLAVAIMGQTLYFKFSGDPKSIALFTELGMEPQGRIIIGALELLACILLLLPSSAVYGAILSSGLMTGAIIGHFTHLGWEGDRFSLMMLAFLTLASCLVILYIRRKEVPLIYNALKELEHMRDEK